MVRPTVLVAPWQEEALTEIFGQADDDGNRRIKMAYFEVPKKAGKAQWTAGLVLFVLVGDANSGCQGVWSGGSDAASDERLPGSLQNGRAKQAMPRRLRTAISPMA